MSDNKPAPGLRDEKGFRALTELAPDFVTVVDVDGVISYVSPAIERVTGYLPEELIGRSFFEFVHPEDQQTAGKDWAQIVASNEVIKANLRFRHKDGSYRFLETLSKNHSSTPELKGVVVSTRDITQRVVHEDALRSAFTEVNDLYNNAPCGYHSLDENGVIVRINDTELRWLGRTRDEVEGKMRITDLLSAASLPTFQRCYPEFMSQGQVDNLEFELVRKDGSVMPVLLSATAVTDDDGRFIKSRSTMYDITERKLAESTLRKANRALRALSAVNSEVIRAQQEAALLQNVCRVCVETAEYRMAWVGYALTDEKKTVSPVAAHGFEEGYLERVNITWADNERGRGPTGRAIRTGEVQVCRDFLTDPLMAPWREDAMQRGYRSSVALPLRNSSGPIGGLMIYATEPDAFGPNEIRWLEEAAGDLAFGIDTLRARARHKHAEKMVEHLAYFDLLTGLPNRNQLLAAIGQTAEQLPTDESQLALLNLNVVHFNDIQSGIGVRKADDLLRLLAERLQKTMHKDELLARIGGDEFAVLLRETDAAHAKACGKRIEEALIPPFEVAGVPINVQMRIGAAMATKDDAEPEALLLHSGIAARQALKRANSFALYGGPTEAETPEHLALISGLRAAIEAGELVLHYQPKVDMTNGKIAGVEALVRWQHPERGLIPPDQFIPIAEKTGLIRPLTYKVLETAVQQCHQWQCQGFTLPVAVNVSMDNLNDPDFPGRIDELLRKWEVPAGLLQLEITESVLMEEPEWTLDLLGRLKKLGISASIDDFGTGYSSLSYVASLPIEALKIDRTFIVQMAASERTRCVVSATIALAHSLGIRTVGEGVESSRQLEALTSMGCNEIQGFFFSRPVTAEKLRQWASRFSLESYGVRQTGH